MDRRLFHRAAMLSVLVTIAGCASSVYEGKYAWEDGWREAEVVRIAPASELGGRHTNDCRYGHSPAPAQRYAVVSFRTVSKRSRAVVPIAADSRLAAGDLVYANVRECAASAIVPRRGG